MAIGKEGVYKVREIKNIREAIFGAAEIYGDKDALLEKNKETDKYEARSYNEFVADIKSLGTALCDMGLKDKRVVVMGENRYFWAVSYMAVVCGTGTVVPVDVQLNQDDLKYIFESCKPDAVIFTDRKATEIKNLAEQLSYIKFFINMDGDYTDNKRFFNVTDLIAKGSKMVEKGDRTFIDAEIDNEETLIILYTSATTSVSKAVQLSHRNIASNIMAMSSMIKVYISDVFLSVLPLHHTYECTCGFLCVLYLGASIGYSEGLRYIKKNLDELKPSVILSVPLLFEKTYKTIMKSAENSGSLKKLETFIKIADALRLNNKIRRKLFSSVIAGLGGNMRLMISGAAAISPTVSKFYRAVGIDFLQGYGLTECSPIICLNSDKDFVDESAGKPLPGVEVVILDKDSEGIGEICAKGPNIMKGYMNMPEENAKAFEGGYFHTGDLGYMDKNDFVYITGRKKSVIVTKTGKNIFPEELEQKLDRSKYVEECLVFGVTDKNGDSIITASVYPALQIFEEEFNNTDKKFIHDKIMELVQEVNSHVPTYKAIKKLVIRDNEFEKTTTRKIKRYGDNYKAD
ncbi:MAG: Long-chain-fatty-acid--CoA ligase FadD15 [Firmicutes bacterium ADurb.Bin099]|jgi:long-chain acyl-CoA synthetase|nr:MAG: Long-chain-fatty-acid--CoA ligase FadD15 [Firmicutes bacterium ADurb.Bin099]HPY97747.1 AMP-binding protein [Clostridia bacterium]HQC67637.1 AMP-binding protein [Clostridia bacterium]